MGSFDDEMLQTVKRYKLLAEKTENQQEMIKDSAVVQFLVYALEGTSNTVTDTAMCTLELLANNQNTHTTLRNTFGVMEALETIAKNLAPGNTNLSDRAQNLHRKLEDSKHLVWQVPKEVTLLVPDMTAEDCSDLWQALSSVSGVISCNFDVEQRCCTLTVFSSLNPQLLVNVISTRCSMDAEVFTPGNQSFLKEKPDVDLPAYLPEEDSPIVEKKAVARRRPKRRESSWFAKAANVLVESFFW